jgi:hypothetical protein
MVRLIGNLSEGSLLRRTLLVVGTFVLGSGAFVAIVSLVLVTLAKSVLPPHAPEAAEPKDGDAMEAEDGAAPSKPAPGKPPRTKRLRSAPAADADHAAD